jgi:hypothetical protein
MYEVDSVGYVNAIRDLVSEKKKLSDKIMTMYSIIWGHGVAQLVEALRYKPEGRGFDGVIEIFIGIILPAALWPWGLTQPLTEIR